MDAHRHKAAKTADADDVSAGLPDGANGWSAEDPDASEAAADDGDLDSRRKTPAGTRDNDDDRDDDANGDIVDDLDAAPLDDNDNDNDDNDNDNDADAAPNGDENGNENGNGGGATDEKAQEAFRKMIDLDQEMAKISDELKLEKLKLDAEYDRRLEPMWKKRSLYAQDIPKFWTLAFENHPSLGSQMDQSDLDVFNYLREIEVEKFGEYRENFRIIFKFDENPFFTDKQLVKGFINRDILAEVVEYEVERHPIHWKPGKDLTIGEEGVNDDGEAVTTVSDSFFNWFKDDDWNVGVIICDDLYPAALNYYNQNYAQDDSDDANGQELLGDDDYEEVDEETLRQLEAEGAFEDVLDGDDDGDDDGAAIEGEYVDDAIEAEAEAGVADNDLDDVGLQDFDENAQDDMADAAGDEEQ